MLKGICKKGHDLTEDNSYFRNDNSRTCKICAKERRVKRILIPELYDHDKQKMKERYQKNTKEILQTNRTRWHNNKDKYSITAKKWHTKNLLELKTEVLTYYGNDKLSCVCCGETIIHFLTLDHINGRQPHERGTHAQRSKYSGRALWAYLKRQGFPEGYQTLCINCNMGKHINKGICPHKQMELAK